MQELKHKYDCKVLFVCPSRVLGCRGWAEPWAAPETRNWLWDAPVQELVGALAGLFLPTARRSLTGPQDFLGGFSNLGPSESPREL